MKFRKLTFKSRGEAIDYYDNGNSIFMPSCCENGYRLCTEEEEVLSFWCQLFEEIK